MSDGKEHSALRLILMLAGSGMLFLSMLGAGKLLWEVLSGVSTSTKPDMLGAKLLWLAILFFAGWGISLFNIRVLQCLVHPLIIQVFLWLTLAGILAIYGRIIFRFYAEDFGPIQHWRYSIAFAAGFAALISLHLLIEGHDLRIYAAPIAAMIFLHILMGGMHYVFRDDGNPTFALGDSIWLVVMLVMAGLIGRHFGLLNPFRKILNAIFPGNA